MNRRNFIENSGKNLALMGLAGLSAVGISGKTADSKVENAEQEVKNNRMLYRRLGKTGIELPIVSMGVMNANVPGLVKAAWEQGIRHFDTAWVYQNGNNEKMVGSVLHEIGAKREEVIIGTKALVSPRKGKDAKAELLRQLNESLSRLKMDYVDIFYYHDTQSLEQINDPYIVEAFTELKEKKKIRFSGFSTHVDWPDIVNDAAERKFYDVILISYNYSMHNDQRVFDAIKKAYDSGIGLIAMKTQCQQGWYKRELSSEMQSYYSEKNMNTALLKWVLRNQYITTAVPGFTTFDQLKEDILVALNLDYTKEEENFLRSRNVKLAMESVCRQCGTCMSSCPYNVDIPSLMRTHMYLLSYGNPLMARITLDRIDSGNGLDKCAACSNCTGRCRYNVPVSERINELKGILV